jgi:hypothetical protein
MHVAEPEANLRTLAERAALAGALDVVAYSFAHRRR